MTNEPQSTPDATSKGKSIKLESWKEASDWFDAASKLAPSVGKQAAPTCKHKFSPSYKGGMFCADPCSLPYDAEIHSRPYAKIEPNGKQEDAATHTCSFQCMTCEACPECEGCEHVDPKVWPNVATLKPPTEPTPKFYARCGYCERKWLAITEDEHCFVCVNVPDEQKGLPRFEPIEPTEPQEEPAKPLCRSCDKPLSEHTDYLCGGIRSSAWNPEPEPRVGELPRMPPMATKLRSESWADYWRRAFDERTTQLATSQAELIALREQLQKFRIFANCGGIETPFTCTYDPDRPHKIYGGGLAYGDGTHICETHQIRKAEAELSALREQLAAMTEDRNLWQGEHNEDCPNLARQTEPTAIAEALEFVRALAEDPRSVPWAVTARSIVEKLDKLSLLKGEK